METLTAPTTTAPRRWRAAAFPFLYEINTWPWLRRLGAELGRPVDLASVPGSRWDELAALGFDAVWLMGVWRRSPAGVAIALADPPTTAAFSAAVPDWGPDDVVGSPYCVRDYVVDDRLGGPGGWRPPGAPWPSGAWGSSSTSCPTTSPSTIRG